MEVPVKHRKGFLLFLSVSLLLVTYIVTGYAAAYNQLQVSFINVGQGDSALIRDASGFDILIDGGKTSAGPTVVAYLREQAVDDIEVMVASHADSDHIGGLIDVLELSDIPVESVIYSGYPGDTATWGSFVSAIASEGITLTAAQFPMTYTWGETTAHILNPISGLVNPETNDASIVVLLEHGSTTFLFPGDIDSSIEADVLARGTPVAAEILKVAHHGSAYSSSEEFLSAVQPKEAIISVGDNSYGHPADETLDRLLAIGARIWRTDQQGTILVISDGITYTIQGEITNISLVMYLPLVINAHPPLPPTPTPTETPITPVPTEPPTATPTPTQTPLPPVPVIEISYIFYDGLVPRVESDEYAQITNSGTGVANLQGWRLNAGDPGQDFIFPSHDIQPGQSCRVYTNEYHPESCGFSFGSASALWNNSEDCGYLYNSSGVQVDEYCY